jgi:hypothetical protein
MAVLVTMTRKRRTPMSPAIPTIDQAIDAAKDKLSEANYFLGGMREKELWSHENLDEAQRYFQYELSAFLSAARSVPQILAKAVGQSLGSEKAGWKAIDSVKDTWSAAEQKLERTLKVSRNLAVHSGEEVADSSIELVPHSRLPRRPQHAFTGRVMRHGPPGTPEPRRAARRFTIEIDGVCQPALECCRQYLGLMDRIITAIEASRIAAP